MITVQVLQDQHPIYVKATMYKHGLNYMSQCGGRQVYRLLHAYWPI